MSSLPSADNVTLGNTPKRTFKFKEFFTVVGCLAKLSCFLKNSPASFHPLKEIHCFKQIISRFLKDALKLGDTVDPRSFADFSFFNAAETLSILTQFYCK